MPAVAATAADVRFVHGFEGRVLKAYRCPAGVVTIGDGFTMGSTVFARFWQAKLGRDLRMGDTITPAECDTILKALLEREYGAAVSRDVGPSQHHQWAGACSTSYNCGIGALKWRWAKALKAGEVAESARLLRVTAVTANGRKLAGLVRRRAAEARLIETGNYGFAANPAAPSHPPAISTAPADVKWYQERLKKLGYKVAVTGNLLARDSDRAVRLFQTDQGLTVDGQVGPATRAAIIRALDAKQHKQATAGAGTVTGAATGGTDLASGPPIAIDANGGPVDPATADVLLHALLWGLTAAAVIAAVYFIWRYRGAITGRRVPT